MAGTGLTPFGPGRRTGVAVVGAGEHGRVVASVLEAAGVTVAGHYDDDPGSWGAALGSANVIGPLSAVPAGAPAVIGVGDNLVRKQIAARLDADWVTVVHPFSWIHPDVPIGQGTVVGPGSLVQVGAHIGAHVILNNRSGIGHDVQVDDYAHITVSHLGGSASVGEGALLGIGSVVLPRVRIGAWATVGAGAVVTADVAQGATVIGNPARERDPATGVPQEDLDSSSTRQE